MKLYNVGLIGYKFMGKAHSHAYKTLSMHFRPKALPVMKAICGRTWKALKHAAEQFGWESYETDWRALIKRKDIDIVDVSSPNNVHKEQVLLAARMRKHIICEKPLANNLADAREMLRAVERAGVKHTVMFNYRRVPALALAREIIRAGELGEIRHFRAFYLQDWIVDEKFPLVWRLQKKFAGSGALGDIGSHIIDMGHFLIGNIREVVAHLRTFVKKRPLPNNPKKVGSVTVDDSATFIARFENGALGSFEATRFATGRKNFNGFEIYGSKGSLLFNFEDMNELLFCSRRERDVMRGFKRILVTEPSHPYISAWWPPGHIIGYEHTFVHSIYDFMNCLAEGRMPSPDFRDAVRCQAVLEAVSRSAKERRWAAVPKI
jgi:predicted dehydrogenase